ncbi:hypothetical protein MN116_007114 [Schistosoma mekongi]|uniref:Uncharacterized protein n=1 Tax=Schistosoma mekongi TaxID=38744 RepID=A0AAE1Z995_SCHME|nr:hypothetical protein MN116_007114 [Schistosoma mekongi]
MDPYSPSHPTDQDMDLVSSSPATPEQDANQNQLPPNQSFSDVVPLLFNSDTFACIQDTGIHQPCLNVETPDFDVNDEHNSLGDRECIPHYAAKSTEGSVSEETKHNSQIHAKPSSVHKRSAQPHHRRSKSRSPKRSNRLEDKVSRRSRSHSRHRVRRHRSRSRPSDRRRSRSRTPPRRSRVADRIPGPRSRSRSPAKSRRSFNERRVSRFSDVPNLPHKTRGHDSFIEDRHKNADATPLDASKSAEEQSVSDAVITDQPTNSPIGANDSKLVSGSSVDICLQNQPRPAMQPPNRWQNTACNNSTFFPRIPQEFHYYPYFRISLENYVCFNSCVSKMIDF